MVHSYGRQRSLGLLHQNMQFLNLPLSRLELAAKIPYSFILSPEHVLEHPFDFRRSIVSIMTRWFKGPIFIWQLHHPDETLRPCQLMCIDISVAYTPSDRNFRHSQALCSFPDRQLCQLSCTSRTSAVTST